MIACGAAFESTIETLALLVKEVEPDVRCAISRFTFSNVYAPSLPRPCKVRLQQMEAHFLMSNSPELQSSFCYIVRIWQGTGNGTAAAWALALSRGGVSQLLVRPQSSIPNGDRITVFSLLGRSLATFVTSDSPLAQMATHLTSLPRKREHARRNLRPSGND